MSALIRIALTCLLGLAVLAAGCAKRNDPAGTTDHPPAHGADTHADSAHATEQAEHVAITPEARTASGIEVQPATPRRIRIGLTLPGEIVPDADRLAHIVPRFPGIAREVRKRLGDEVSQGDVLAVVEGNQSLATYEVRSLISGTVIEKHITLGEFVRDDADVFVVANLSTVWANISVYARDVSRVRRGQAVMLQAVDGGETAEGVIEYIGSSVGDETRAASARVVIPNPNRQWKPGTFVTARIITESISAAVAVPDAAIQRLEGRTCVFVETGGGFVARTVTLGRSDGQWTEITSALAAGERIATRGSFILKSELLKSEAGHGH